MRKRHQTMQFKRAARARARRPPGQKRGARFGRGNSAKRARLGGRPNALEMAADDGAPNRAQPLRDWDWRVNAGV